MNKRIARTLLIVVFFSSFWGNSPAYTQEIELQVADEKLEATIAENSDPNQAFTTEDPTISVDELELLVKPLTVEELNNEAVAWLLLLKEQVQEISNAEIAIKKQNEAIDNQEEATKLLEQAQKDLAKAQETQKNAAPDSEEYEEATKLLEKAQEELEQAQDSIKDVQETKAELKEDETLSDALEEGEKKGELDEAKAVLEQAEKDREELEVSSLEYESATEKIDALEEAIKVFEEAQEAFSNTTADTPEYTQAEQEVEKARLALQKAQEAITGIKKSEAETDTNLAEVGELLENTELKLDGEAKVAQESELTEIEGNLEQKEEQLSDTVEQLKKQAEEDAELKNQLVETTITQLREVEVALIERFNIVLDELEAKGGDAGSYRQYVEAISAIDIGINLEDTEGIGVRLISWLKSEAGGLKLAINAAKFLAIVIFVSIIAQILSIIIKKFLTKFGNTSLILRDLIVLVVNRGGILVGIGMGLAALGVNLTPILALIGGASFVLAFALQNNLDNLASGLLLLVYKPFDVGDEIRISDLWGWVDNITLANTKIKGWQGQLYTIPNSIIISDTITNVTADEQRQGSLIVKTPSDFQDINKVKNLLLDIAKFHKLVLQDPAPSVYTLEYDEFSWSFLFGFWTKTEDFWSTWDDLIIMIQERSKQEDIPIAIPTSDIRRIQ